MPRDGSLGICLFGCRVKVWTSLSRVGGGGVRS